MFSYLVVFFFKQKTAYEMRISDWSSDVGSSDLKNVARINALEPELVQLDDGALRAKTDEFRRRIAEGATLDSLLPEAFAVCREASRRALGLRQIGRAPCRERVGSTCRHRWVPYL